jgi:hypothetical protein
MVEAAPPFHARHHRTTAGAVKTRMIPSCEASPPTHGGRQPKQTWRPRRRPRCEIVVHCLGPGSAMTDVAPPSWSRLGDCRHQGSYFGRPTFLAWLTTPISLLAYSRQSGTRQSPS